MLLSILIDLLTSFLFTNHFCRYLIILFLNLLIVLFWSLIILEKEDYISQIPGYISLRLPRLHVAPARGADPPLGSDSARGLSNSTFTLPQLADQNRLAFSSPVKFGRYPQCTASCYEASSFICYAFPHV